MAKSSLALSLFICLFSCFVSCGEEPVKSNRLSKPPEITDSELDKMLRKKDYEVNKMMSHTPYNRFVELVFVQHIGNDSYRLVNVHDGTIVSNPYEDCRPRTISLYPRHKMKDGKAVKTKPTPVIRIGMTKKCVKDPPVDSDEARHASLLTENREYWLTKLNDKYLFPDPRMKGKNIQRLGPAVSIKMPDFEKMEGNVKRVPVVLPKKIHYIDTKNGIKKSDRVKRLEKKKQYLFEINVTGSNTLISNNDKKNAKYRMIYAYNGYTLEDLVNPKKKKVVLRDRQGNKWKLGGSFRFGKFKEGRMQLLAYKKKTTGKHLDLTGELDFRWEPEREVTKTINLDDFDYSTDVEKQPKKFIVYSRMKEDQIDLQDRSGFIGPNKEVAVYVRGLKRKRVNGQMKLTLPKKTYHFAVRYDDGPTEYLKKNIKWMNDD